MTNTVPKATFLQIIEKFNADKREILEFMVIPSYEKDKFQTAGAIVMVNGEEQK